MANRSGWAYGFTYRDSEWLTIVGSAHTAPPLRESADDAEKALGETQLHTWKLHAGDALTVAHVTETWHSGVTGNGMAYRITPGSVRVIDRAQEGA